MYSHIFKNTPKNKEYRYNEIVSNFFGTTSKVKRDYLPKQPQLNAPEPPVMPGTLRQNGVAYNYFDVSPVIPAYIGLLGYNDFVAFVQRYYDWVYTSNPSENTDTQGNEYGSGYFTTTEDLFKLIDVDKISRTGTNDEEYIANEDLRKQILNLLLSQYAEGFGEKLTSVISQSEKQISKFLSGIREEFYIKKGNLESIIYYFKTLYGQTPEVDEPKKYILRLDGGVPEFASLETTDRSLLVSEPTLGLGELVIQDSYWYQDYSYLLNVGADRIDDADQRRYLELAHPLGMKVFFNVTNEDYIPPDDFDGEFGARENSILGNYHPYNLTMTSGLTYTTGCTFDLDSDGSSLPTFNHPSWSSEIVSGQSFGNINIGKFFFLFPADESPNIGLPATLTPGSGVCAGD